MMYTAKFSDLEVVTHALVGDRRASLLAWQARCTRRQIGAFLRLQRVGSVTLTTLHAITALIRCSVR